MFKLIQAKIVKKKNKEEGLLYLNPRVIELLKSNCMVLMKRKTHRPKVQNSLEMEPRKYAWVMFYWGTKAFIPMDEIQSSIFNCCLHSQFQGAHPLSCERLNFWFLGASSRGPLKNSWGRWTDRWIVW